MNEALFPALGDDGDNFYSTDALERKKKTVQSEIGFLFDALRLFQSAFHGNANWEVPPPELMPTVLLKIDRDELGRVLRLR